MLRRFGQAVIFAASVAGATAWADAPVKLPPGTRAEDSHFVSGRGLRDTTDFVAKELARRGLAVDQIGPYGVRGVEVTRFISRDSTSGWLAIHVMRTAGKTLIFFVPRPRP